MVGVDRYFIYFCLDLGVLGKFFFVYLVLWYYGFIYVCFDNLRLILLKVS